MIVIKDTILNVYTIEFPDCIIKVTADNDKTYTLLRSSLLSDIQSIQDLINTYGLCSAHDILYKYIDGNKIINKSVEKALCKLIEHILTIMVESKFLSLDSKNIMLVSEHAINAKRLWDYKILLVDIAAQNIDLKQLSVLLQQGLLDKTISASDYNLNKQNELQLSLQLLVDLYLI